MSVVINLDKFDYISEIIFDDKCLDNWPLFICKRYKKINTCLHKLSLLANYSLLKVKLTKLVFLFKLNISRVLISIILNNYMHYFFPQVKIMVLTLKYSNCTTFIRQYIGKNKNPLL